MESYLYDGHLDLATPDGSIATLSPNGRAEVFIYNISPAFKGFQIPRNKIFFNLKSTLAQLGLHSETLSIDLDLEKRTARVQIQLKALGSVGQLLLKQIPLGAFIGKLFAADDRRLVRNADYLTRMYGRSDREGRPLLSLGGLHGSNDLFLEQVDGRMVAYLSLQPGVVEYSPDILGFLPTLTQALKYPSIKMRHLLMLHQQWNKEEMRTVKKEEILLVKTLPLHIRTVFGRVVESLLAQGFHHTSASVLEPNTKASGDIYELYGSSSHPISDIPLEFYTLEPHREHVFFADRDQLQMSLENPETLFQAFKTAPEGKTSSSAVFVVKGEQLLNLKKSDWIERDPHPHEFPGLFYPMRQAIMVERYILQQPSYPFLKAIQDGLITSQGILLTQYLPSPLMKRMLLSDLIQRNLKGIYFKTPSRAHGDYFSHEDRSLLLDLAKFGIPVYWVDETSNHILKYVPKPDKDAGMFVPLHLVDMFVKATAFGIYGSNLIEGNFETQLRLLLEKILQFRDEMDHPLLSKSTPIALVTGGGPGAMALGNRVAKSLGILSCANIMDFRTKGHPIVNEQNQNPYIDAKMTYRIDRLVERQAEFNLDFPILLQGGIGTDFEFALEEVRRKIGSVNLTPVLLFGSRSYWEDKITTRYQCNLRSGTIKGSEWISNCFYQINTPQEGAEIYRQFFEKTLPIGPRHPAHELGFKPSGIPD